jgi:DNA modification methylase
MDGEKAEMIFTDPPYNGAIVGNVSGLGKTRHREFAMASGEMSPKEFARFLAAVFANLVAHSLDGSIHFICMDWRHMAEILEAGGSHYSELKNLIVWAKDNGGMGAFYRSRHELIFAFKNGSAPHINSFELGQHGRYRTNVWEYRGVNTLKAGRMDELSLHPTVKPVAMIADAIKDVSRRGGVVLDLFGGSGSTLIAAHKTGRKARLCELDPVYCDRILSRWEVFAKDDAERIACGLSKRKPGAAAITTPHDVGPQFSHTAAGGTGSPEQAVTTRSDDSFHLNRAHARARDSWPDRAPARRRSGGLGSP